MNPNRGYRKSAIPENAKRVFEGVIFDVYQWEQKLYDGSFKTFEKLVRPDTAVIFPVLEDGRILLIEDSQPQRGSVLTAPAGRMEEGETPEQAALRELKEETGYAPKEVELLYSSVRHEKIDHCIYVFVGRGCTKVAEPHPDAGEKIVPHPVSFDEFIEFSASPEYRGGEFTLEVLRAKLDPAKMEALKAKFLKPL